MARSSLERMHQRLCACSRRSWFLTIPVVARALFQFCVRFLGEHLASATLVFPSGNGSDILARIRLKVLVERLALQG
jgi:hypothetical protein